MLEIGNLFSYYIAIFILFSKKINPVNVIVDQRLGFSGKMINFLNEVQTVADSLPNTNEIIVLDKISPNGKQKKLIVDSRTLHIALMILKDINPHYAQIQIRNNLIRKIAQEGEASLIDDLENLYDTSI